MYYENLNGQECPLYKKYESHKYNNTYTITEDTCIVKRSYPAKYDSEKYSEYNECHFNSTIISHSAYLMWNGIDGNEQKKIDSDTLSKLWYKSLQFLHSNATFAQCANALTLSATQMVRGGLLTPNQLECVVEALDKVGIQSSNNYPTVTSGAKLYVNDINLDLYDNYHLTVSKIPSLEMYLQTKAAKLETVIDTDVTDSNGYALGLEEGNYQIKISDNLEDGSSTEFTKIIKVIEPNLRNKYWLQAKEVTIYTDFGSVKPFIDIDNLVTDAYTYSTSDEYGMYNYNIPKINLDYDNVVKINKEIYDNFYNKMMQEILNAENGIYITEISYTWAVNGDILSLCIHSDGMSMGDEDDVVYNVSISTGENVPDRKVIAVKMTENEYRENVKKALGSLYWIRMESSINDYKAEGNIESLYSVNSMLQKTLSDENIADCRPHFRDDGNLYIAGMVYCNPEPMRYVINLNDYEFYPNYAETIEIPEETEPETEPVIRFQSTGIAAYDNFILNKEYEQYMSRDDYYSPQEYAVLDIDKNGTPELIINGPNGEFSGFAVFSYDPGSGKISKIQEADSENPGMACRGISYSEKYSALVYMNMHPYGFNDPRKYYYSKISGGKLVFACVLGYDFDENGNLYYYFVDESNVKTILGESEYQSYLYEFHSVAFQMLP